MAQGSSKGSKAPPSNRTRHQARRSALKTKKGARFVAPKKNKAIQHMKTKATLSKLVKGHIEQQLAMRADAKPFKVVKVERSEVKDKAGKKAGTGQLLRDGVKKLGKEEKKAAGATDRAEDETKPIQKEVEALPDPLAAADDSDSDGSGDWVVSDSTAL